MHSIARKKLWTYYWGSDRRMWCLSYPRAW